MKTYLTYGFFQALGVFALILVAYILGFHSDAAKMTSTQWPMILLSLAIMLVCLILGTRARRADVPPSEEFGYGSALAACVMIGLFACLIGIVTTIVYQSFINPGYKDVLLQAQAASLEAKGLSQDKIDQIQKMSAMWMTPPIQAAVGFVMGMIFNVIGGLIIAIFLKRPASEEPPAVA